MIYYTNKAFTMFRLFEYRKMFHLKSRDAMIYGDDERQENPKTEEEQKKVGEGAGGRMLQ